MQNTKYLKQKDTNNWIDWCSFHSANNFKFRSWVHSFLIFFHIYCAGKVCFPETLLWLTNWVRAYNPAPAQPPTNGARNGIHA